MLSEVLGLKPDPEDVVMMPPRAGFLLEPQNEGLLTLIPIPYGYIPALFASPENQGVQRAQFYLFTAIN